MGFVVFRKGGMIPGATPTLPPAGGNNSGVVYDFAFSMLLFVRLSEIIGDLVLLSLLVHSVVATPSKKVA